MDYDSPFALAKEIGAYITRLISSMDIDSLTPPERAAVALLKNHAADLRLDMRDYGSAESPADQQRIAKDMAERLNQLQAAILKVSEYNLISATDVAQLSAHVQQLKDVL